MIETTALSPIERAAVALGAAEHERRLMELAQQSRSIVAITNTASYQECHGARMTLKSERVALEKLGKGAREDAQAFAKCVIAEEKRLIAIIEPEETRLQAIQTAHDEIIERQKREAAEKEAARIRNIQDRIATIIATPGFMAGKTSEEMDTALSLLLDEHPHQWAEEFLPLATDALHKAKETLVLMMAGAKAQEEAKRVEDARIAAEKEELFRLREEARQREERERLGRQAREAEEARQAVIRDAEARTIRLEQQAEAERLDAQRKEQVRLQAELDARLEVATRPEPDPNMLAKPFAITLGGPELVTTLPPGFDGKIVTIGPAIAITRRTAMFERLSAILGRLNDSNLADLEKVATRLLGQQEADQFAEQA